MKETAKANAAHSGNTTANAIPVQTQQEESPKIEDPVSKIPSLFLPEHINQIYQSKISFEVTTEILKSHYRRTYNKADYNNDFIISKAEYDVNALIFLKETFPKFPDTVLCKLLNALADLIELPNEKYSIDSLSNDAFLQLTKTKVAEFKEGLKDMGLLPTKKEHLEFANNPNKPLSPEGRFYLSPKEVMEIIGYIKTDFLPYIQMWYYFNNDSRTVMDKKIEIIINKPIPSLSLNSALEVIEPVVTKEDDINKGTEKSKEEEKQELDQMEEAKKGEEDVEEKKPMTYLDLLNKMDLNAETRKIIIEKIEGLNKEVETKISDRQKQLDDKVKEMEDTVKGKKK